MEKEELHKKLDNFLGVITKRVWMGNYFRYWSAWMSAGKSLSSQQRTYVEICSQRIEAFPEEGINA